MIMQKKKKSERILMGYWVLLISLFNERPCIWAEISKWAAQFEGSLKEWRRDQRRQNRATTTGIPNSGESDSMAKSDGGSESGRPSSESDSSVEPKGKISEYEKQRLSRIAENKARLDALGISKAAEALMAPSLNSSKRRGKRNSGEQDDDYRPGDGDDEEDEDEEDEEDEEFSGNSNCKRKASTSKRKVLSKKTLNRSDPIGDDDDLQKAIALSLQDSVAGASRTTPTKKIRNYEEAPTWNKKKPELMSKIQMTDDELVIYFYQFDEAGKGFITLRDLVNMATVHDFTWTEEELQDMIRCFDIDKDGKLSLDEFRKIVTRCRMLKES